MQDPELIANVSLLLLVEVLEAIVGMGVKYFISFDMHDLRDGLMQHHTHAVANAHLLWKW